MVSINIGEKPLLIHSWHNAIVHIDADAFFASVEQASNPSLMGKPVVIGAERGMAIAVSYEAKKLGIERGMMIHKIKKISPNVITLESDFEKYSIFSMKMFDILRRFSPQVEEYSIDEAFVDITGLRRLYKCSYGEIGALIKETIKRELGITVSVGVSLTKVLAKIASKHQKPDGLTVIPGKEIHLYLKNLPIEKVWGVGFNTSAYCKKLGINTALDFARKDEEFIKKYFTKPYYEIWQELNGISVYAVKTGAKDTYKSISKAKSFKPTANKEFLYSQLVENLDNAMFKARRYRLFTKRVVIFIKTNDFKHHAVEIHLPNYTSYPEDIFVPMRNAFDTIFDPQKLYRQTGVVLLELSPIKAKQLTFFSNTSKCEKIEKLYNTIDMLKFRYGKHIIKHATSLISVEACNNPSLNIPIIEAKI